MYVNNQQKTAIYELQASNELHPDYFSPQLLSSTYSATEANKYYNEIRKKLGLSQITIRFASNNPMNPNNLANTHESEILKMFNENDKVKYYKEIIKEKDGDYLYYAIPTQANTAQCMHCHSDPSIAPVGLVNRYGTKSGFYEELGQIRAILSTKYPLKDQYSKANTNTIVLSFALLLGLLIVWFVYYKFTSIIEKKNELLTKTNVGLEEKIQKQIAEMVNLNDQLKYVIEGSHLGYWDWYPKTKEHYVNDIWLEMLGLSNEDICHQEDDWSSRIHKEDIKYVIPIIQQAFKEKKSYVTEYRMKHKDGHWVWIQGSGAVVEYDENDEPVRVCGTHMDISEKKSIELKMKEIQEYLDTIFTENPNIIIVRDANGLIHANKLFFEFFTEFEPSQTLKEQAKCICDFFEYVDDPDFVHISKGEDWIDQILNNSNNKVLIKREDQDFYFTLKAKRIFLHDQVLQIVSFTDITQIQMLKEKLKTASIIDELTGLYNRRYFNEFFNRELHRAKREKKTLTFMMVDVDYFKNYNDNYGHLKGDKVLRDVAQQIKSKMKRAEDFAFRLGGEEFGVIVTSFTKGQVLDYALEIKNAISQLEIEHKFTDNKYEHITVSIGLKHVDFEIEDHNIDEIYAMADKALYQAKSKGRNTVVGY